MDEEITAGALMSVVNSVFDRALSGITGMGSCEDLARDYLEGSDSVEEAITSLIRWQIAKTAAGGALAGLGGLITLPAAIPLDLANLFYHQMRMIGAIACMCGMDPNNDRVRTACITCLAGNSAHALLRSAGVQLGEKLAKNAVKSVSAQTIKEINKAVGTRLLTKFGQTGAINLGKAVPLVGALISGVMDGAFTDSVGEAARSVFYTKECETARQTEILGDEGGEI
ncbi:MAG: EcsC family protein [Desulfovibrionaceae bacterium]|nr:EcsC family protein [Desulfovibrionaceae bacterium]